MARTEVSDLAALQELAKTWRAGNKAFKEMFDVAIKEPAEVYNKISVREGEIDIISQLALDDCNDVWAKDEARTRTKDQAKALRVSSREGASKVEVKRLRRNLRVNRKRIAEDLVEAGGIVTAINTAERPRDAFKNKVILITCLGRTVREFTEAES